MAAFTQTVRVPRCVEKRIPVTYTSCVPRVVCCRVPIDPCGVPIESWVPAQAPAATESQEPTPATSEQKTDSADAVPELGADAPAPEPIDGDEPVPAGDGGSFQTPEGATPAPQIDVLPLGGTPAT